LASSALSGGAQVVSVEAPLLLGGGDAPIGKSLDAPLPPPRAAERAPLEVPALRASLAVAVVDRRGEPVPGVSVALVEEGGTEQLLFTGESRADGRVLVPVPPARAILRARDSRYESAFAAVVVPWSTREPTLVVAPKITVAGRVLDDEGAPLADAAVRLWIDPCIPVAHARPLDSSGVVLDLVTTDAHGAFAFPSMVALEEAAFTVYRPGYPERVFGAPLESRTDLELVLPRPQDAPLLRGRVRDESGRPAAGALVVAHPLWTHADADGRFELLLGTLPAERRLVALLPGEAMTSVELTAAPENPRGWPEWVELELSRAERALEGTVLDEFGRPLPGARVWLADPTPAGLELAGTGSIEARRAGSDKRGWWWVESDARGAFRLPGVFAREYRVRAADPRTLALGEAVGTPAASFEIVLRAELVPQAVTGRVLDERGTPVADVRVALTRSFYSSEALNEPIEEFLSVPTLTDTEGRFVLPRCAREGTRLDVRADGILHLSSALSEVEPGQPLELEVSRRAYLRVELEEPFERADSIALEDAEGGLRFLVLERAWCPHRYPRAPLVDGRSLLFTVSMKAAEVVFQRGEQEVGRAPLTLRAGELTVLRW
ncbi:MAG: carboxypeptidase-like regulatory domain-containing protein, partial [Planctomycetota bacterium]